MAARSVEMEDTQSVSTRFIRAPPGRFGDAMAGVNPFSSSGEVCISPSTIISIVVVVVVSYAIGWGLAKLVKKLWLAPKNVELSTELMVIRVIK